MTDVFTKSKRSEIMSQIRSKWTKLDKTALEILQESGMKFETYPPLFGNPDFLVYPNLVIFCDSSFWHGRNWPSLRLRLKRGGNSAYWVAHIAKNRRRDKIVTRTLRKKGYKVVRLWDSDIYKRPKFCVSQIKRMSKDKSS